MPESLNRQIEAYQQLRPQIVAQNTPGWALIAHEKFVSVFAEFDQAAMYADAHFPDEQVLIRHTSEQRGMIPFIVSGQ